MIGVNIDTDQNGFLRNRGASLSIRLIEDILRYTERNNIFISN